MIEPHDIVPIMRSPSFKYDMTLYVYPVSVCGEDLQKGKPLEVTDSGADLHELKLRTDALILSVMPDSGEAFIEMRVTHNGEYCDCDEWWVDVDLENNCVKHRGCCK